MCVDDSVVEFELRKIEEISFTLTCEGVSAIFPS